MSGPSERKAGENKQWREPATDWWGVWGERSSPRVREKRSKLSRPPFRASRENAATMNDDRTELARSAQREVAR